MSINSASVRSFRAASSSRRDVGGKISAGAVPLGWPDSSCCDDMVLFASSKGLKSLVVCVVTFSWTALWLCNPSTRIKLFPCGTQYYSLPRYGASFHRSLHVAKHGLSKIISIQSLHYLTLCAVLPPLLYVFTNPVSLWYYNGGAATVGMIMDWREMASRPTVGRGVSSGGWNFFESAWSGVVGVSQSDVVKSGLGGWKTSLLGSISSSSVFSPSDPSLLLRPSRVDGTLADPSTSILIPGSHDLVRGWIIAAAWILACVAE